MARAFDGTVTPDKLPKMACGGTPYFDHDSGYSYRCDMCGATIGSIAQPDRCKQINEADANRQETSL